LKVLNFIWTEGAPWTSDRIRDELADVVSEVTWTVPPIRARGGKEDKANEDGEGHNSGEDTEMGFD
jgi:hypothetical protein